MSANRPIVLTIAGFDPSGGAGLLADCKTFEQLKTYGLAINTANTIQTETTFLEISWTPIESIIKNIQLFFENYTISAVKIGIVKNTAELLTILSIIRKYNQTLPIVWDPVLKSSTEFSFLTLPNSNTLLSILNLITLVTPNYNEIEKFPLEATPHEEKARLLASQCAVLLKGGHHPEKRGIDQLFTETTFTNILPTTTSVFEKHGSGCILSAAITAYLAQEYSLVDACKQAKKYTETVLKSNPTQLGYHYVS